MLVHVKGVHRRKATDDTKECASALCEDGTIPVGEDYARVLRHNDKIEMFHVDCFEVEFGEALLSSEDKEKAVDNTWKILRTIEAKEERRVNLKETKTAQEIKEEREALRHGGMHRRA